MRDLLEACKDRNLHRVISVWGRVCDHDIIDDLTNSHFDHISACLVDELEGQEGRAFLTACEPTPYGLLKDMAVVAAAASQQKEGLYALCHTMLAIGRPGDVLTAFENAKDRTRSRLGIRKEDLFSWDRETRLNARMPGDWVGHLVISIAALTMLDRASTTSILTLLDTNSNIDGQLFSTELEVRKIGGLFAELGGTDRQLINAFNSNIFRLRTAMYAFHPAALRQRIRDHGSRQNSVQLHSLYRSIVAACTESDPLIWVAMWVPKSFDGMNVKREGIPLPPATWISFCRAFSQTHNPGSIRRLILEDLPRLMPLIPPIISSRAIMSLLRISTRRGVSISVKTEARDCAEEILRTLTHRGEHMHADISGARIDFLSTTGRVAELRSIWAEALAGRLGRVEAPQQTAFIAHFVARGDMASAVSVFCRGLDGQHFDPPSDRTYDVFFRRMVSSPLPFDRKLLHVKEVLALQPSGISHSSAVFCALALSQMQTGQSPEKCAKQAVIRLLANSGARLRGILDCGRLLEDVLKLGVTEHGPDQKRLRAARQILSEVANRDLHGQSTTRVARLWAAYLHYIVRAKCLTMKQRRSSIDDAWAAWPTDKFGPVQISCRLYVIDDLMKYPDDDNFDEGLTRWYQLKREGFFLRDRRWLQVMIALIQHGRREAALRLAKEALDERAVSPYYRRFWDLVRQQGLVEEAGLDGQLFLWRREGGQVYHAPSEGIGAMENLEDELGNLNEEAAENLDLE